MPIPTELVGSLPRPMQLREAYQAYDDGKRRATASSARSSTTATTASCRG
jgi:methionine synthase II (cobalamin-independent)